MSHTPGPWEYRCDQENGDYVAAGGFILAGRVLSMTGGRPGQPEREANARLMAAAPELLEALKKAVHELNEIRARDGVPYNHMGWKASVDEAYFSNVVDESFAAIAKAEGRV